MHAASRRKLPPLVRASLADTYRSELRGHILPAFGDMGLDAVTTAALEDFRSRLTRSKRDGGKGLKMKTARCIMDGTFRALYRDARDVDKLVTGNPFAALRWPRLVTPKPDPFTAEERDLLLKYFWEKDRHYYALVYTMFFTGMRTGEATGLRWGAVDLRRGELHVRVSRTLGEDNPPKTKKSDRTVLLMPEVVAVLRDAKPLRVTADTFVFATQIGTPMDEERFVEKHWHRALTKAKVRPRKFYATRHTFITLAVTKGTNLKWLADYTGTSVDMIEQHYAGSLHHAAQMAQLALLSASGSPQRSEGAA